MNMRKLVHFEIPSMNLERSKKFYENLFGWRIEAVPGMDYSMINVEDGIGGGLSKGAKPSTELGIGLYFEVDDIPASLAKAAKSGGKELTPKTAIGGGEMGYFGEFSDPDGNRIGLWSKS